MRTLEVGREKDEYTGLPVFIFQQLVKGIKNLPQTCKDLQKRHNRAVSEKREYAYMGSAEFAIEQAIQRHKDAHSVQETVCCEEEQSSEVGYFFDEDEDDGYDEWERQHLEERERHALDMRLRYEKLQRVVVMYTKSAPTAETIDFSAGRHEAAQDIVQPVNLRDMNYTDYVRSFVLVITTPFDEMVRRYMQHGGLEKVMQHRKHPEQRVAKQSATALRSMGEIVGDETQLSFTNIRRLSKAFRITQEEGVAMCEKLVNTMYRGHDWRHRKISELDEARLLELMDDYANASNNEDVDFLCSCVHDVSRGITIREAIFIGLALRDADPATLKKLALQQTANSASA